MRDAVLWLPIGLTAETSPEVQSCFDLPCTDVGHLAVSTCPASKATRQGLPYASLLAKTLLTKVPFCRYDLAKAVERWGGVFELASALKYEVPQGRVRGALSRSLTTKIQHDNLHAAKGGKASDQILPSEDLAFRNKAESQSPSNSSSGVQRRPAQSDKTGVKSKQQFSKSLRREIDAW